MIITSVAKLQEKHVYRYKGKSLSLVVDSVQSINWKVEQIMLTNERQISSINGVEKPHLLINLNSILFYYSTTES